MTSTRRRTPPVTAVLPLLAALLAAPATAAGKPMKVYVLAGQSNMEGQAVVDLDGKDYNDGKGTLVALLAEPTKAAGLAHLNAANGTWRVRDDVWMWYQPEAAALQAGPLAVGYTVYGDQHHFGPELELGHVVGAAAPQPARVSSRRLLAEGLLCTSDFVSFERISSRRAAVYGASSNPKNLCL